MRWIRYLLVFVTLFALAARVAAAQDGEGTDTETKARQRWERLSEEERQRVRELWEGWWRKLTESERKEREQEIQDTLKGSTEQERRDLLERLARVRARVERERLKERENWMETITERFRQELPEKAVERLDGLEEFQRQAIYGYAWGRMFEVMRDEFVEKLTPAEREEIGRLKGAEKGKRIQELQLRHILDGLPAEERKEIEALSGRARRMKELSLLRARFEQDVVAARKAVASEVADLLDLPGDELAAALAELWDLRGIHDPDQRHAAFRKFRDRFWSGDR